MPAKKLLFALTAVLLFFGGAEVLLWLAGVETLRAERDPWRGFAEGVRVYEADPASGLYHTPPRAVVHSFNRQEFLIDKPDDALRVFVIGGSSAFGFPYGAGRAFPRVLGEALRAVRPDATVESINAAGMSYGSLRLRILSREILDHAPDVLVIYSGHNEYVESDLHARLLAAQGDLGGLRSILARSRLYSSMARALERLRPEPPTNEGEAEDRSTGELLGLDVDREAAVDVLPDERAEVLRHFEENIADILDQAREAAVPVLLCTVPSNVAGWVPNQSVFGADVGLETRGRVESLVATGRAELKAGDSASALAAFNEATELAPGYAAAWFWRGRALEAGGDYEEARQSYFRARDADARPSRAESGINEAIRRLGQRDGVILVDIERAFEEAAPNGLLGFNLFEDYVHPRPAAHRRIAYELWKAMLREGLAGPIDPDQPTDVVAFERASGRDLPPVGTEASTADLDPGSSHPSMLFNLAVVLENQGEIDRAMAKYRECLAIHPSYYLARENLARLLFRQGRIAEAAEAYRGVLNDNPERVKSMIGLGESLRRLGQAPLALGVIEHAIELDPRSVDAHNSLGGTLSQLNRQAEAEQAFLTATDLDPTDPETWVNLGLTRLFQEKIDAAGEAFEAALTLEPHNLRARNGKGAVLTERGELDAAEAIFRENLRVAPDDPFARSGLETIATRRGS